MKSKIEEKIKNAREATNEMFAALEKLNEELLEKLQPEFKEGDYFYCQEKEGGNEWLSIFKKSDKPKMIGSFADYSVSKKSLHLGNDYLGEKNEVENLRLQTPSEIALLDSKLAEQGKRFDKEKLELVEIPKFKVGDWFIPHKPKENKTNVFWAKEMDEFDGVALQVSEPKFKNAEGIYSEVADWHFHPDWCEKTIIPKHKEPIIGEMAIFWDNDKCISACKILDDDSGAFFIDNSETYWTNAILFESPEQYKDFLKS